jgi:hypothetical protein
MDLKDREFPMLLQMGERRWLLFLNLIMLKSNHKGVLHQLQGSTSIITFLFSSLSSIFKILSCYFFAIGI